MADQKTVEQKCMQKLMSKAARGDAKAQGQLGINYLMGNKCEKDFARAKTWLTKAAENGDPQSQVTIGFYHAEGVWGFEQDTVKAINWYLTAAAQDEVLAMQRMADCYGTGFGVEKDVLKELEWYRRIVAIDPDPETVQGIIHELVEVLHNDDRLLLPEIQDGISALFHRPLPPCPQPSVRMQLKP